MMDVAHYIGIEFEDRGRGARLDCWGLVQKVYREQLGIELPSYTEDYTTALDGDEISALVARERLVNWTPVETAAAQPGDVVVLKVWGRPWHCGVIVDYPKFLHIECGVNACVERLDSVRWALRTEGIYRYTGAACTR